MGGLNISQQATFMLQVLDDDDRHHHMATKANEAPSLRTLIPQKTPPIWIKCIMYG